MTEGRIEKAWRIALLACPHRAPRLADANGNQLVIGDKVTMEMEVTGIFDFCDHVVVTIQNTQPVYPADHKTQRLIVLASQTLKVLALALLLLVPSHAQQKKEQGFAADAGATFDLTLGLTNFGFQTTSGDLSGNSFTGTNSSSDFSALWCLHGGFPCVTIALPANLSTSYVWTMPLQGNGPNGKLGPAHCQGQVIATNGTEIYLTPGANGDTKCNTAGNNVAVGNPVPYAGVASHLVVIAGTAPTANLPVNLRQNGAIVITCTVLAGQSSCSDAVTFPAFAGGDRWTLSYVTGSVGDAAANIRADVQFQ
jgi:hypothetical protein